MYHAAGDYAAAEVHLTAWIESTGGSLLAWWLLADVFADEGRIDDAVAAIDAGLALGTNPDAMLDRAEWLIDAGRLDEAALGLGRALDRTGSTAIRVRLFDVHVLRGDGASALAAAEGGLDEARVGTRWQLRRATALRLIGDDRAAAEALDLAFDAARCTSLPGMAARG